MNETFSHPLTAYMWHPSQQPNRILGEARPVSSKCPTHSPHPLICLCPAELVCRAPSVYLASGFHGVSSARGIDRRSEGRETGWDAPLRFLRDSRPHCWLWPHAPMTSASITQALETVYPGCSLRCFSILCRPPDPCLTGKEYFH